MEHLRFERFYFVEDYKDATYEFMKSLSKWDVESLCKMPYLFEKYLYMDPDGELDLEKTSYYNWLTLFLNLRARQCGKEYEFAVPFDAGTDLRSEAKNPKWFLSDGHKIAFDEYGKDPQNALERDQYKILVFDGKGEKILRLTSDQLGFTAFQGDSSKWDDARYPLYRYLKLVEDKNAAAKNRIAAADFISRYVYDTRTLGGAFVWPTNYTKWREGIKQGRRCEYNVQRGVSGYIEDRVDLTLLEVRRSFKRPDIAGKKVILLEDDVMRPSDEENMEAFLDIFKSFEGYVDFFMLNDFVENVGKENSKDYVPKDITTGKAFKRNENGDFVIGEKLSERSDLSESDLKEILGRVQSWTMERTGKMEKILEPYA